MNKYSRKNFFKTVGKGILLGMIGSVIPIKKISARRENGQKINVQIHPSAVKRNKKV